jgi:putative ABC transport system substrate-binding protein
LLLAVAGGGLTTGAQAQRREPVHVGWLTIAPNPQIESFRAGMQALGYIEGRSLTIEQRDAAGDVHRLAGLAADFERHRPDVVVTIGIFATNAARSVLKDIPIIFVTNDPVSWGLVDSLARPGGNMTGLELMSADISVKWLELLAELLPQATRLAAIRAAASTMSQVDPLPAAAASIGRRVAVIDVRDGDGYLPAFEAARHARAQGMIVLSSAIFHAHRRQIVDLAAQFRLPAIYEHRDFTNAGGLMSYGPDVGAVFFRIATYVDRIFRGARPADLPVERPTRFELVVNQRTARTLGLTIPSALLARADEVIE